MDKKNRSVISSVWNMKCPRCREGELFEKGKLEKPFAMPDKCSCCGQNYMPEPGFYYGAMFISYIFWGWFCVIFGFTTIWFFGMTVNQATLLLAVVSAIFFIWLFRISRTIWIHIAIKYNPRSRYSINQ